MTKFNLQDTIQILERTPSVLKTLLAGLPDHWTMQNEGGETWSPYDVVGHFIHGEKTDWIPRARLILSGEEGNLNTFISFDRFAQFDNSKGKTLADLLEEFAQLRAENIAILKSFSLTQELLNKQGIHPELGLANLRQLLATWTVHDLGHIVQISRVMAKQYTNEVGVWKAYLAVLK